MKQNFSTLIKEGAKIVDVRTPSEFAGGHVQGSLNIPLQELTARIKEITSIEKPVILCCASGNRSGQAEMYLRGLGMQNVYNGGSWLDVNFYKNNA